MSPPGQPKAQQRAVVAHGHRRVRRQPRALARRDAGGCAGRAATGCRAWRARCRSRDHRAVDDASDGTAENALPRRSTTHTYDVSASRRRDARAPGARCRRHRRSGARARGRSRARARVGVRVGQQLVEAARRRSAGRRSAPRGRRTRALRASMHEVDVVGVAAPRPSRPACSIEQQRLGEDRPLAPRPAGQHLAVAPARAHRRLAPAPEARRGPRA